MNATHIIKLFEQRVVPITVGTGMELHDYNYDHAGIDPSVWGRPSSPPAVDRAYSIRSMDFMDLRGDFYWPRRTPGMDNEGRDKGEAIATGLPRLQEQAAALSLTLPDTFVRFTGSKKLRARMPLNDDSM